MQPIFTSPAATRPAKFASYAAPVVVAVVVVVFLELLGPGFAAMWLVVLAAPFMLLWQWWRIPRRFEVWRDRLVVVMPRGRREIPFDIVIEADVTGRKGWLGFPVDRFDTSPDSITIRCEKTSRFSPALVLISPEDRDEFLEALNEALGEYKRQSPSLSEGAEPPYS